MLSYSIAKPWHSNFTEVRFIQDKTMVDSVRATSAAPQTSSVIGGSLRAAKLTPNESPVRRAEMERLQQTNFPEYVRQLAPTLAPQDRANPFAYSLDHAIPIEVKRQVFAEYQSGQNAPRVEITTLAGTNATYTESAGPNGTIKINADLLGNTDPARRGQMEAFAVWGHMEEVGHWGDARAQQLMGTPGGDSKGDEGARYATLALGNVTANTNPNTFIARYDIPNANGTVRTIEVDTAVLNALATEKLANGSMARENRVGDVENFGPEGHYQTTYITAAAAAESLGIKGPEADRLANQMALGSQLPDMLANYDAYSQAMAKAQGTGLDILKGPLWSAISPSWGAAEQKHLESVYEGLHALPRGKDATTAWLGDERAETRAYVVDRIANGDYLTAGIAIHRYGDLHAHVKPNGTSYSGDIGHALAGHTPDYLYTQNGNGQAQSWNKATDYQSSLSSAIAEGLAGHERGAGRTISTANQNAASEYARTTWRTVYDGALRQGAADPGRTVVVPRGRFGTQTIHYSGADAAKTTETYFRNAADRFINSIHGSWQGSGSPLTFGQMEVGGGFTPNAAQIRSLETVMDRFDAPR
jgi:hypothetical protein